MKPILFSTDMVRAILAGRKTETRRIVKPQPVLGVMSDDSQKRFEMFTGDSNPVGMTYKGCRYDPWPQCFIKLESPYGKPGDVLWVREKWKKNELFIGWPYHYYADNDTFTRPDNEKWKPSIHMPRAACRLFLQITDIRVERLRDITEEDARHEGVLPCPFVVGNWKNYLPGDADSYATPVGSFCSLWQSINGPESWEDNPWVWVMKFKQIEKPE